MPTACAFMIIGNAMGNQTASTAVTKRIAVSVEFYTKTFKSMKSIPSFSAAKPVDADCDLNDGYFPCKDKKSCIPAEYLCDGLFKCDDHSDEGEACTDRNFEPFQYIRFDNLT